MLDMEQVYLFLVMLLFSQRYMLDSPQTPNIGDGDLIKPKAESSHGRGVAVFGSVVSDRLSSSRENSRLA